MLGYKFLLNNKIDITSRILNFSYDEKLDDLASSFSFEYVPFETFDISMTSKSGDKEYVNKIYVKKDNQLIYKGVITDVEHDSDVNKYIYSGFDYGFYLNKNQVIAQFKKTNIGTAIESLCKYYQIDIEDFPKFQANVTKNYKGEVFADIVKELLQLEKDKGGVSDVYVDCKTGKFKILKYTKNLVLGSVIANNILIDSFTTISNVKVKHSIQELKNRVIYVDNNEKSRKQVARKNDDSIETFGLLQYVEQIDTSKENNLTKLAEKKLKELNVVTDTISLSMLGDYNVKKGVVIPLSISEYGLNGTYLIKSVKHTLTSAKEVVDIEVEERK